MTSIKFQAGTVVSGLCADCSVARTWVRSSAKAMCSLQPRYANAMYFVLRCCVLAGQLAVGTCEIVMLNRDSSIPRRTIARQTARCACRRGQIAGTTRARPACVDGKTSHNCRFAKTQQKKTNIGVELKRASNFFQFDSDCQMLSRSRVAPSSCNLLQIERQSSGWGSNIVPTLIFWIIRPANDLHTPALCLNVNYSPNSSLIKVNEVIILLQRYILNIYVM